MLAIRLAGRAFNPSETGKTAVDMAARGRIDPLLMDAGLGKVMLKWSYVTLQRRLTPSGTSSNRGQLKTGELMMGTVL
jgi:hypothetical protein